jgi:microprocessor complex subunit DGCR8
MRSIAMCIALIYFVEDDGEEGKTGARKEWVMNPNGKSYVCILHEFVQHALRKQPDYKYRELGN